MIKIVEVKINSKKVYQNEKFFVQVKVDKDRKILNKLSLKLSSKLGGGISNGTKN